MPTPYENQYDVFDGPSYDEDGNVPNNMWEDIANQCNGCDTLNTVNRDVQDQRNADRTQQPERERIFSREETAAIDSAVSGINAALTPSKSGGLNVDVAALQQQYSALVNQCTTDGVVDRARLESMLGAVASRLPSADGNNFSIGHRGPADVTLSPFYGPNGRVVISMTAGTIGVGGRVIDNFTGASVGLSHSGLSEVLGTVTAGRPHGAISPNLRSR